MANGMVKPQMPNGLFMKRDPPARNQGEAQPLHTSLSAKSLLEVPIHLLKERQKNEWLLRAATDPKLKEDLQIVR